MAALAMGISGLYQFAWSSIRGPIGTRLLASEAGLGTVFTLFVIFQTSSQFPAGWVRDRWGPRRPLAVGAILLAVGYAGTAHATQLWHVYLFYSVGGVGAGIAYTVAINTPVKWFTERRGLATGIVGMTYGGLSFLFIPFIRGGITTDFEGTLLGLGVVAGVVTLGAVAVLRDPTTPGETAVEDGGDAERGAGSDDDEDDGSADAESADESASGSEPYTWRETVRTWQFWLLYAVFVVVNGVGLMIIGKVVTYADQLGLSAAAATTSASLVAIADAGGVVLIGGVSDRFGRERTVAATLVLCGVALAAAVAAGGAGLSWVFVVLIGAAAFFRSPPFVIFPSLVGEYYGARHSSANYALLYSAKLWGGVFGGTVASALIVAIGWSPSFALGAGLITAAGIASVLLRPV